MAASPSFDDSGERYVRELSDFLELQSVSRLPSGDGMRSAAEWVAARLDFAGGRVVETDGHPVVLGEWLGAPGAPTILVYGHYDVLPGGDEGEWETPAFEPTVRGERIYARGASDDKGPVFVALETARAFHEQVGALPLNVRFLIEGEEEIGSPSLERFLASHRAALTADLVVSADGAMWRASEPSITIAAKGMLALKVVVTGPASDLHAGRHGGAVQNPNHALAAVVTSFHTPDGSVAVPGFYDGVTQLDLRDREALEEVPFDEEIYRSQVGVPELHGEPGYTTLERLWTRPTLEVIEVRGGGPVAVIPRSAQAHVTCRLVPGQQPEAVLAAIMEHVRRVAPAGVDVCVEAKPGGVPAYAISADHPGVRAGVKALRAVYPDQEPLLVRTGSTLPAAVVFERALGLKTLLFSFSTSDENLHAPNEFFRLARLREGMAAWVELWQLLAENSSDGERDES